FQVQHAYAGFWVASPITFTATRFVLPERSRAYDQLCGDIREISREISRISWVLRTACALTTN
ncbi:hypothetical protein BaRGS_00010391, partial [Batillaria attramentaria]